jgi:DNA polymerase-3 subunit delta
MPEIRYKEIDSVLVADRDPANSPAWPVVLIFGSEMLVEMSFEKLLDRLLPASARSLNVESIDETRQSIHDVIERLKTFSLLAGTKVVAMRDSRIFYGRQDKDRLLAGAKAAYEDDNLKKAASFFLMLLADLNLTLEDLDGVDCRQVLGIEAGRRADDVWLDEVLDYCREHRLPVPTAADDSRVLEKAIHNGFPDNNFLIITTDLVDKRRTLFKTIKKAGLIIDCTVPQGDRRADRIAQEDVLREQMRSILSAAGKKMDHPAYQLLVGMTGFDLRTFCQNLEKLIDYVGQRRAITVEDLETVLNRSKKHPVYELTNALADRNLEATLVYLHSILAGDFHPLQIQAALVNQVRKLLMVKDFIESPSGGGWQSGCSYPQFQKSLMPAIVAYDGELRACLETWQQQLSNTTPQQRSQSNRGASSPAKKGPKISSDLMIARNPKNAYPVFQQFRKSENFSKAELIDALILLAESDLQLKSSELNPELILEKAIFRICRSE